MTLNKVFTGFRSRAQVGLINERTYHVNCFLPARNISGESPDFSLVATTFRIFPEITLPQFVFIVPFFRDVCRREGCDHFITLSDFVSAR